MSLLSTCIKESLIKQVATTVSFLFVLWSQQVVAISFETLLMPGKVIEGHAKYEETCDKCHNNFDKSKQKKRCVACHDKIDTDLKKKLGFHGKSKTIQRSECKTCHTEHKGRKAKVVHLDKWNLNHDQTDFKLTGKHKNTACELCHKQDKLYREATKTCFSCHEKKDVHKGKMGKKCADCHQTKTWSKTKFDHDKTKFKLKQAHKKVACDSCHPNQRYKDIPKTCKSCHQSNDVHSGNMGNKCSDCHSSKEWKKTTFNHDKKTKFKLRGAHKKITCATCHTKPVKAEKKAGNLGKKCIDCHKLDDVHAGRNGDGCDKCHNNEKWGGAKFDHDKKSKFPLMGAHKKQACHVCHQTAPKRVKTIRDCKSCHKTEDVHNGELGENCSSCHNTSSWNDNILFEHDITSFPLTGMHPIAPCESCHLEQKFKGTGKKCESCHAEDDAHDGNLGSRCETCHNPNDWMLWTFDHNTQTEFKLEDTHKNLQCKACHSKAVAETKKIKRGCYSCHSIDDFHNGDFGRDCERCHNSNKFSEYEIGY